MTDPIALVLFALTSLATIVAQAIGLGASLLHSALAQLGVPPAAQSALVIIFVVMLIGAALRVFGRLAAALVLVLLLLLVLHHAHPPAQPAPRVPAHGQVQI